VIATVAVIVSLMALNKINLNNAVISSASSLPQNTSLPQNSPDQPQYKSTEPPSYSDFPEVVGWDNTDSMCSYAEVSRHVERSPDQLQEEIVRLKNSMVDEVIKRKNDAENEGVRMNMDKIKQICVDVGHDFEAVHKK
jgi:hypothetical protein